MMDVKSITREGDQLIVKGKMMGSMATAIYVRPEDLWQALAMLPISTVLGLPLLLIKGYIRHKKST